MTKKQSVLTEEEQELVAELEIAAKERSHRSEQITAQECLTLIQRLDNEVVRLSHENECLRDQATPTQEAMESYDTAHLNERIKELEAENARLRGTVMLREFGVQKEYERDG